MTEEHFVGSSATEERASALDVGLRPEAGKMTAEECSGVVAAGFELAQYAGGTWLLISGEFVSDNHEKGTEGHLGDMLRAAFGYPRPEDSERDLTLHVLLESPGGSLDSAYACALYLSAYSDDVRVYVPGRAKSASTLLALGADELVLSAFGELGPLDTQIRDPRNPASHISALDCYQSVDYVRDFGIRTLKQVLPDLVTMTQAKVPVQHLLGTASDYTRGVVQPMMESVSALDFGGWGRSLRIGEQYARRLLRLHSGDVDERRVEAIAARLVFGYTHHLFPIDYHEAIDLGLSPVALMEDGTYSRASTVVERCHRKSFIGFLSRDEAKKAPPWYRGQKSPEPIDWAGREVGDHVQARIARSV